MALDSNISYKGYKRIINAVLLIATSSLIAMLPPILSVISNYLIFICVLTEYNRAIWVSCV